MTQMGTIKKGCNVVFQTKQNTKVLKLMSRRGQLDNSYQVLCAKRLREESEIRAERKEARKKKGISKMGLGGLRREKSTRNSSTFTLIPRCVVGKTQPLKSLWQNVNTQTHSTFPLSQILPLFLSLSFAPSFKLSPHLLLFIFLPGHLRSLVASPAGGFLWYCE